MVSSNVSTDKAVELGKRELKGSGYFVLRSQDPLATYQLKIIVGRILRGLRDDNITWIEIQDEDTPVYVAVIFNVDHFMYCLGPLDSYEGTTLLRRNGKRHFIIPRR